MNLKFLYLPRVTSVSVNIFRFIFITTKVNNCIIATVVCFLYLLSDDIKLKVPTPQFPKNISVCIWNSWFWNSYSMQYSWKKMWSVVVNQIFFSFQVEDIETKLDLLIDLYNEDRRERNQSQHPNETTENPPTPPVITTHPGIKLPKPRPILVDRQHASEPNTPTILRTTYKPMQRNLSDIGQRFKKRVTYRCYSLRGISSKNKLPSDSSSDLFRNTRFKALNEQDGDGKSSNSSSENNEICNGSKNGTTTCEKTLGNSNLDPTKITDSTEGHENNCFQVWPDNS